MADRLNPDLQRKLAFDLEADVYNSTRRLRAIDGLFELWHVGPPTPEDKICIIRTTVEDALREAERVEARMEAFFEAMAAKRAGGADG